ncbi:DUF3368 domain-containing protein [Methylobacterium sp. JK268]
MRVVADTGPLNYLVLIEQISILPNLFERIAIPEEVAAELRHPDAPPVVRSWMVDPPPWLTIQPAPTADASAFPKLDAGERAALLLASTTRGDLLLMDDRAGVAAARASGLAVTGTLGLLTLAARRKLVDLEAAFAALRATNFRCRPALLDVLLEDHQRDGVGERR